MRIGRTTVVQGVAGWDIANAADFGRTILTPRAQDDYLRYWRGALRSDLAWYFRPGTVDVATMAGAAHRWYRDAVPRGSRFSLTAFELAGWAEPEPGGDVGLLLARVDVLSGRFRV